MSIIISKASVRRALEKWFIAARAGETLSAQDTAKLSALDASAQSSDFFYDLLCNDEDSSQYTEPVEVELAVSAATFIIGEDLVKGEIVQIDPDTGYLVARRTEVNETQAPKANDEFFD